MLSLLLLRCECEIVYDCITQIQGPDICPTILFLIKWTLSTWDKTKDSAAQGKHLLSVNLISNSGSARRFIRGLQNRCSVKRRQARGDREVRVTHEGRSAKNINYSFFFFFSNSSPCAWLALRARLALFSVRLNVAWYVGLTSAVRGARAHFLNIGSPLTATAWVLLPNLADVQCFFSTLLSVEHSAVVIFKVESTDMTDHIEEHASTVLYTWLSDHK